MISVALGTNDVYVKEEMVSIRAIENPPVDTSAQHHAGFKPKRQIVIIPCIGNNFICMLDCRPRSDK